MKFISRDVMMFGPCIWNFLIDWTAVKVKSIQALRGQLSNLYEPVTPELFLEAPPGLPQGQAHPLHLPHLLLAAAVLMT